MIATLHLARQRTNQEKYPTQVDLHPEILQSSSSLQVKTRFRSKDGIVSRWLKYWDSKDRYEQALDDYRVVADSGIHRYECAEALDTVCEICRKREGRSKAFEWLIRSMIENRGWNNWWSNKDKFRDRVRTVVRDYPERWREFVVESSECEPIGQLEGNGIVVGFYRLVYFLLEVGQYELAKQCAMEMVDIFRDEVSSQPLVLPDWAK